MSKKIKNKDLIFSELVEKWIKEFEKEHFHELTCSYWKNDLKDLLYKAYNKGLNDGSL